jgi:hypothetical protein
MSIQCENLNQFLDVISGLVQRGLTFSADAGKLMIKLEGGY